MKASLSCLILLLLAACATAPMQTDPSTSALSSQPSIMTIYLLGADQVKVYGWLASVSDLPKIIQESHPQSIVISHYVHYDVPYSDALKIRDIALAAGVKDVQIDKSQQ